MNRWLRNALAFLLGLVLLPVLVRCVIPEAHAQVRVPAVSATYRLAIERESARYFGLQSQPARLAAQIHQESGWNPNAASAYAQGLTQFTPATARWLPTVCPAVGVPDPWDAQWALRAQACYMAWLLDRVKPHQQARGPMTACTRWMFAFRAYNGGEGWLNRERLATQRAGGNANDWGDVAQHRVRAAWAHKENTHYPWRILLQLEPSYIKAGWTGQAVCP